MSYPHQPGSPQFDGSAAYEAYLDDMDGLRARIERMEAALADVRSYCSNAIMGRWRHDIIKIVDGASQQQARENPK